MPPFFRIALSSASAIRVCHPGPVAFQRANVSGGRRIEIDVRATPVFGRPRGLSILPATGAPNISGRILLAGFAFANVAFVHSGFSGALRTLVVLRFIRGSKLMGTLYCIYVYTLMQSSRACTNQVFALSWHISGSKSTTTYVNTGAAPAHAGVASEAGMKKMRGRSDGKPVSGRGATQQQSGCACERRHADDDLLAGHVLRSELHASHLGAAELGHRAVDPARVGVAARRAVGLRRDLQPVLSSSRTRALQRRVRRQLLRIRPCSRAAELANRLPANHRGGSRSPRG